MLCEIPWACGRPPRRIWPQEEAHGRRCRRDVHRLHSLRGQKKQREVADVAEVTEVTIRNRYKSWLESWINLPMYRRKIELEWPVQLGWQSPRGHRRQSHADEAGVHPGTSWRDSRREAIDIYDHIDLKELKEAYLACIPQLGI